MQIFFITLYKLFGDNGNNDAMINKPRILIVEDEIESRKYLQLILKKKFDLDFCENRNCFFDHLSEKTYSAILMDISLKNGYTGVDLIKELKRKSSYKNIPVICISAHAFGEDRRKAEDLGADVFLTKPVGNKTLINVLDQLIAANPRKKSKV